MKKNIGNISKLLLVAGCVSVFAGAFANAAPLVYDLDQSQPNVRTDYSSPNKIRLEGDVYFNDNGQKINLSLRNTDVQQVLRMFADKAGLNIVFHESVAGSVTMDLVDVSLADAFKMVMKMNNLTYVIKNKTIMVVATDQAESLNLTKDNINILPVKYADAAYIAQFLNTNVFSLNSPGLSYGPIVTTNADTNELLIFGSDADFRMAKKIVEKFDRKPAMTTYRVNHTTPYEMGKMICETLFNISVPENSAGQSTSKYNAEVEVGEEPIELAEGRLGGGTIACTVKSGIATENISSYQAKPSLILYVQQELGTLTLVGGSQEQIQMVNDFIMDNDRKQPQAYLEIQILALSESGTRDLQNFWLFNGKHFNITFDGNNVATDAIVLKGPGRINQPRGLQYQISALIEQHKAKVLSNPKIIVTNGKTATIDLTEDYVSDVTVEYIQSSLTGQVISQKTYNIADDKGIKVSITPFISPDGYVSLSMKPEYSDIIDRVYGRDENGNTYQAASLLQRRNLDLYNIRIKDGETLVLGGMIGQNQSYSTNKIPLLGDIPIIGALFRSNNKINEKTEVLFMITPRIIKDSDDIAEL